MSGSKISDQTAAAVLAVFVGAVLFLVGGIMAIGTGPTLLLLGVLFLILGAVTAWQR